MTAFTDDYLLFLMAQASDAVSASFHAELATRGVAVSTWRILASLEGRAGLTVGELAERCLTKQPTMTRMLDRLTAEGLVTRAQGADRRRVTVRLTPEGARQARALIARARAHEAEVLAGYDGDEVAALKSALRDLARKVRAGSPPHQAG